MAALVLHYHPLDDSFSAALRDAAVDALGAPAPLVVPVRDGDIEPSMLDGVDHLVVVAPTWWGSLPARLLQALTGLIGGLVDDGSTSPSPLRSVARLSVVTTHGSSRFINRLQGEPGLQLWRRTVVPLCAPGADFEWIALYGLDRLDEAGRRAFIDEVRAKLTTG